jgi:branched-chain amino acid transport system substrate-binding protein
MRRIAALLLVICLATTAHAADTLTIGFLATMTGPGGVTGAKTRDGLQLAIDLAGGKLGGLPTNLIVADDQANPEIARQLAEKFILQDKADIIVAGGFSNILLAIARPVMQTGTILLSVNGGPSELAGKDCNPLYFNTSWVSDTYAEAAGAWLQRKGVQSVYAIAPNYTAGREILAGFARTYKGHILASKLTPMSQMDFSAEFADIRAAHPGAIFAFYPGGLGIQFIKQYAASGLAPAIPLTTVHTIDNTSLPALGDAAIGQEFTTFWGADLDVPANRRFVAAFRAKYGSIPSEYSAQSFDAGELLDSAIRAVHGNMADRPAFLAALAAANFQSVRGHFRFANDHYPIQDYYLASVQRDANGQPELVLGEKILTDAANAYTEACKLP